MTPNFIGILEHSELHQNGNHNTHRDNPQNDPGAGPKQWMLWTTSIATWSRGEEQL